MEEEGSAEEEELIVGQVLDELGIGMGQDTPSAPMGNVAGKVEAKAEDTQGTFMTESPCTIFEIKNRNYLYSILDSAVSDLEARLQKLK